MRIPTISVLACGLALSACSLYFEQDSNEAPGPDPCEIAGLPEATPGYPFDYGYYQQVIWPMTQRACGIAGCHAADGGGGFGFLVWDDVETCSVTRSFNELYATSDFYDNPDDSFVLAVLDGRIRSHPLLLGPGSYEYDALQAFIWDAWYRNYGYGPRAAVISTTGAGPEEAPDRRRNASGPRDE